MQGTCPPRYPVGPALAWVFDAADRAGLLLQKGPGLRCMGEPAWSLYRALIGNRALSRTVWDFPGLLWPPRLGQSVTSFFPSAIFSH